MFEQNGDIYLCQTPTLIFAEDVFKISEPYNIFTFIYKLVFKPRNISRLVQQDVNLEWHLKINIFLCKSFLQTNIKWGT